MYSIFICVLRLLVHFVLSLTMSLVVKGFTRRIIVPALKPTLTNTKRFLSTLLEREDGKSNITIFCDETKVNEIIICLLHFPTNVNKNFHNYNCKRYIMKGLV